MLARLFGRFLVVALGLLFFVEGASVAAASENSKFQRDLESLFGATVRTKYGDMSIRQSKGENGRIRKQIIAGKDFSEIQLDQDGDGTVDFLRVTRGTKTVEASEPNRGRFLRLVVSDRFNQGIQESTYLLNLNSVVYTLVKTKFVGKGVRYRIEGDGSSSSFEATDAEPAAQTTDAEAPGTDTAVPATIDATAVPLIDAIGANNAKMAADEQAWIQQQEKIFGVGFTCDDSNTTTKRLAELQRDWWKVLKYDAGNKTDLLADTLKHSRIFDTSCRTAAYAQDFEKMVEGVTAVLISSSKGEPLSTDKTRGRYLRCLEQSGLGEAAARIEEGFMKTLKSDEGLHIRCDWKPGTGGISIPAQTDNYLRQVTVHMCAAQSGTQVNKDGSTINYANVMFHEFIHSGGIADEATTYAAQACCGDPTKDRVAACQKLDGLVKTEKRYKQLETHLSRVSDGMFGFISSLENQFGADGANKLYREFLLGLDNYKDTPYASLMTNAEFEKCVAKSGEATCRAEWASYIRKYADTFFSKTCRTLVTAKKECRQVADDVKEQIAKTIASSMLDNPRSNLPVPPPSGGQCIPKQTAGLHRSFDFVTRTLTRLLFGSEVVADDPDCIAQIGLPPQNNSPTVAVGTDEVAPISDISTGVGTIGYEPKRITVPGQTDTGSTAGTGGRTDSSVGNGGTPRPRNPANSPLPVTRIDSSREGQSVAEQRYRRATDIAGGATRGLQRLRDSFLPRAIAGERESSNRRTRLEPTEEFVAFKPKKVELSTVTIKNPFSADRSIASIDGFSKSPVGGSAAGTLSGSLEPGGLSSGASSTGASASGARGTSPKEKGLKGVDGEKTGRQHQGTVAAGSVTGFANGVNGGKEKVGGLSKEDLLEGLFTRPYREIELRLKRIDVVEALAAHKISIQDATGRLLGSTRAHEHYVFVGFEKPLQKKPPGKE